MFITGMEGTLMELQEAAETRYRYIVWFDYTREAINLIQEGTLLAVPNFASTQNIRHFSILEVTTILPTHYAMEGGIGGYPGFIVEAAHSAAQDWEAQERTSTEDTTKIRVVAIPTNLEIIESLDGEPEVSLESNIGMVGSVVRILDTQYSNLIANNGIDRENEENLTAIGTMTRDLNVEVLLRIEELYRTHFAIFGFTGVGKSNLLSTIVSKVFADSDAPVKLVFYDLMSEYTVLLLDQLLDENVYGNILTIGRNTLPEGLFRYINSWQNAPDLQNATQQLVRYTLMPKALLQYRRLVAHGLRDLIQQNRIKYYHEAQSVTVFDVFFTDRVTWSRNRQAARFNARKQLSVIAIRKAGIKDFKATTFTPEIARRICEELEQLLQEDEWAEFRKDGDFDNHIRELRNLEQTTAMPFAAGVTAQEIIADLNDDSHSSLWVVQAHNPDELRRFTHYLGENIYENRRLTGRIDPLVSFIFDEADEFVRREATGSYAESAEIAQTLARRGRKFGLGIGISTQRIRYLDTNIMAQPHTYFISKLPRLSDRQAVAEAFGVSEDLLNQTFKFKKGEWLLMSHDATGLEAVPIPIKTPNANERISNWLQSRYS